jgi:hypothetical protein
MIEMLIFLQMTAEAQAITWIYWHKIGRPNWPDGTKIIYLYNI